MKRFKTKRHTNKNKMYLFLLFMIVFLGLFIWLSLKRINASYDSFIEFLINDEFASLKPKKTKAIMHNLDLFLNTYAFKEEKVVLNEKKHSIYLYNTHNLETYKDGTSVCEVSRLFSKNLKKLGINTIVEDEKTSDFLVTGLNYYDISRNFIKEQLNKESNIDYYIDIHRDSVSNTIVEINGKKYAKVLFVLGLDNENYKENKTVMQKMHQYLEDNYKGLSKGILEKSGKDVNGIYNQDLGSNVLLIEIGGIDNTKEEIINTTETLSLMLYNILQ